MLQEEEIWGFYTYPVADAGGWHKDSEDALLYLCHEVSCSLIRKVFDFPWHVLADLSPGAASCSGFGLSELAVTSRSSHMSALSMDGFQSAAGTGSAEEGKLRQ